MGAVSDVGQIGFPARDRAELIERLVIHPVLWIEEEGAVVLMMATLSRASGTGPFQRASRFAR